MKFICLLMVVFLSSADWAKSNWIFDIPSSTTAPSSAPSDPADDPSVPIQTRILLKLIDQNEKMIRLMYENKIDMLTLQLQITLLQKQLDTHKQVEPPPSSFKL